MLINYRIVINLLQDKVIVVYRIRFGCFPHNMSQHDLDRQTAAGENNFRSVERQVRRFLKYFLLSTED